MINGYRLRLDGRQKKAKEAEERHVKLQMEENALQSRIHMLSEMEKMYEGYSKAVNTGTENIERIVNGPFSFFPDDIQYFFVAGTNFDLIF